MPSTLSRLECEHSWLERDADPAADEVMSSPKGVSAEMELFKIK